MVEMKLARDERGEGCIRSCILLLVVCAIFSAVLFYARTAATLEDLREEIELTLDGGAMRDALSGYTYLADGVDVYTGAVEDAFFESFEEKIAGCLTGGDPYAVYESDGNVIWQMSRPSVSACEGERLRVRVSVVVTLPLRFGGASLGSISVPLTVYSKYYSKYS